MKSREIQQSINEDIRGMKRIARNIKHMKGKRGYVGVMYDSNRGMTEKQIKEKYDGKVVSYNMEKIMHKDEFKFLSDDMKKLHLESWRTRFSNQEIAKQLGMGNSTLANMMTRLGVTGEGKRKPIKRNTPHGDIEITQNGKIGTPKPKNESTVKKVAITTPQSTQETPKKATKEKVEVSKVEDSQPIKEIPSMVNMKSLISLKEKISGEKLATRLNAIATLVNDDEEYTIELLITRK